MPVFGRTLRPCLYHLRQRRGLEGTQLSTRRPGEAILGFPTLPSQRSTSGCSPFCTCSYRLQPTSLNTTQMKTDKWGRKLPYTGRLGKGTVRHEEECGPHESQHPSRSLEKVAPQTSYQASSFQKQNGQYFFHAPLTISAKVHTPPGGNQVLFILVSSGPR